MKKQLLLFAVLCLWLNSQAQVPPCTGTPGANTVTPVSSTICIGASANLSLMVSSSVTGLMYQWQSSTLSAAGPFSNIPGATAFALATPPVNTTTWFTVIIACSNGGTSVTATAAQVNVTTCTGLHQPNGYKADLRIYPVPASQFLKVEAGEIDEHAVVRIYAIDGREIPMAAPVPGTGTLVVDVSAFAAGIYVLEVESAQGSGRKLFSVAR